MLFYKQFLCETKHGPQKKFFHVYQIGKIKKFDDSNYKRKDFTWREMHNLWNVFIQIWSIESELISCFRNYFATIPISQLNMSFKVSC